MLVGRRARLPRRADPRARASTWTRSASAAPTACTPSRPPSASSSPASPSRRTATCAGSSAPPRRCRSARSPARSAPTRPTARSSRRPCCARLGLGREDVSTQVVPRDRHAELLEAIALAGAGLERFATEIRHLQRTEVREVEEPFRAGAQKGSSAMPHKRNPIVSERITGIARLLRGYAHDRASRTWRSGTSATSRTRRSSAWRCPTRRSCSTTRSTWRSGWWRA